MKRGLGLMLALMLAMALVSVAPGSSVFAQGGGEVIADGFNGPLGVLLGPDGSLYVIDSGLGGDTPFEMVDPSTGAIAEGMMGNTSRVVQILPDGTQKALATLPSVHIGQDFVGGSRLAMLGDKLYATSGEWSAEQGDKTDDLMAAVVEISDGEVTPVADTWRSERRMNPDGAQLQSHPYAIVAGPDGKLWVTDAGGNSLLKVGPDAGFIETIAAFAPIPGVFPNPNRDGEMLADAVPTGIAFDDDGNAFVSLLSGAPFVPGSAKVAKVTPTGGVSDYATGLTMLTDIARGPDGNLYALQFAVFTDQGPTPDSGAIVKIQEGEGSAPVVEGLSFPTSITFNEAGDAFVTTNGVGAPGSGQVVRFAGVAAAGEMAESTEGEMAEQPEGEMTEPAHAGTATMPEPPEGEMAESAHAGTAQMPEPPAAESAEMAEGEMAVPEQLPMTGASFPVSGALATALVTVGLASVGLLMSRKRIR